MKFTKRHNRPAYEVDLGHHGESSVCPACSIERARLRYAQDLLRAKHRLIVDTTAICCNAISLPCRIDGGVKAPACANGEL